jgi:hypothetical protein
MTPAMRARSRSTFASRSISEAMMTTSVQREARCRARFRRATRDKPIKVAHHLLRDLRFARSDRERVRVGEKIAFEARGRAERGAQGAAAPGNEVKKTVSSGHDAARAQPSRDLPDREAFGKVAFTRATSPEASRRKIGRAIRSADTSYTPG